MKKLSRRQLLAGGLAAAGALNLGVVPRAHAAGERKRVVFVFFPEGVVPELFWPSEVRSESDFVIAPDSALAPLQPHQSDISVVRGLEHRSTLFDVQGRILHGYVMERILTGGQETDAMTVNGVPTPGGISIDHFLGAHLSGGTRYPTIGLGLGSNQGSPEQQTMTYSSRGVKEPVQSDPLRALDEYFDGRWTPGFHSEGRCDPGVFSDQDPMAPIDAFSRDDRRRNVLEALATRYGERACRVAGSPSDHLRTHEASIRALASELGGGGMMRQDLPPLDAEFLCRLHENPNYVLFGDWLPNYTDVQASLLAGALANDLTRVGVLQFSVSTSQHHFPTLPIAEDLRDKAHHYIAHQQVDAGDDEGRANARDAAHQISRFYMQKLADFIAMLKAIPEGAGSVFDSTTVVAFSDMSYGASHGERDIPVVLAGNACQRLRSGLFVDLAEPRPMTDLWMTLAHAHDIPVDRWGMGEIYAEPRDMMLPGFTGPIESLLL